MSPLEAGSGTIGGVARRVSSPVLVGRDAEAAQLRAALERAAAGRPAIVVVAGEAGVGKTRLVADLVGRAGELGAVALTGGCLDVGEGVLAYAPLVEALRPLAVTLGPGELDRVLGGARAELARLVPELGPQATGRPVEAPLAPTRLFELLLGVLHRLAERGPVLLVVEDLHWADQSTRDLLGFLVRNLRAGVALVLTYRSDELHRRHPLRPFLAELDRSGRADRLEVGRFDRVDARPRRCCSAAAAVSGWNRRCGPPTARRRRSARPRWTPRSRPWPAGAAWSSSPTTPPLQRTRRRRRSTPSASRPASRRSWRWSRSGRPTTRSPRRCSSAPRRPPSTSATSSASSASATGSRRPPSPTGSGSCSRSPEGRAWPQPAAISLPFRARTNHRAPNWSSPCPAVSPGSLSPTEW